MVNARETLTGQQPCRTGTADFTGTVQNYRTPAVQLPVFITQGINRKVERPGKTLLTEICRRPVGHRSPADIQRFPLTTFQQLRE